MSSGSTHDSLNSASGSQQAMVADEVRLGSQALADGEATGPRDYPFAFARAFTIARIVSRATMATIWPPNAIRLTSIAGRQLISFPLMRNAPIGMSARPIGAFLIRGNEMSWRPAIDVNRIAFGGQIVAIVALLTIRAIVKARAKAKG